jgi:hypothetical protein
VAYRGGMATPMPYIPKYDALKYDTANPADLTDWVTSQGRFANVLPSGNVIISPGPDEDWDCKVLPGGWVIWNWSIGRFQVASQNDDDFNDRYEPVATE